LSKSRLIISLKDFLMDSPSGLAFEVEIDGRLLMKDVSSPSRPTYIFDLIEDSKAGRTEVRAGDSFVFALATKGAYPIRVQVIGETGAKKVVATDTLKMGTRKTLIVVSPWILVPLRGAASFSGSFFRVEYNVKRKSDTVKTIDVEVRDIPRKILLQALSHRGSTDWSYASTKASEPHKSNGTVTFENPSNKCNLFVNDVLSQVGISVAWIEHGRSRMIPVFKRLSPPTAGEWANTALLQNSWSSSSSPLPGDVAAYTANYSDASGHVGFVVARGVSVSAGEVKVEVNDVGFRQANGTGLPTDHDFTVFRRYKHAKIQ
jgi:CHAP domain